MHACINKNIAAPLLELSLTPREMAAPLVELRIETFTGQLAEQLQSSSRPGHIYWPIVIACTGGT